MKHISDATVVGPDRESALSGQHSVACTGDPTEEGVTLSERHVAEELKKHVGTCICGISVHDTGPKLDVDW